MDANINTCVNTHSGWHRAQSRRWYLNHDKYAGLHGFCNSALNDSFQNYNISWLELTNKHEFKSQGSTRTNWLFLHSRIPLWFLPCQVFLGFFHIGHLPRVESFLPVFVFGCGVKMAAAAASSRCLEQITYDIKHMAAVRKREGERLKKGVFFKRKKRERKEKQSGFVQELPLFLSSCSATFLFSLSGFWAQPCERRDGSSPLMSVQLSNTQTEMFAARPLSSSPQNVCAFLTEPCERRTMEGEIKNILIYRHEKAIL